MFRVIKALNHNGVLAIDVDMNNEYILLGKGIGFGKKVNERMEAPEDTHIYLLQQETERGSTKEIINNIEPKFLEIASTIIMEAKKKFKEVDENILCPLADHIAFAVNIYGHFLVLPYVHSPFFQNLYLFQAIYILSAYHYL